MALPRELVVIATAADTVSVSTRVALPEALSVTLVVKLAVPEAVGVPLIVPLLARLMPVGRAPEYSDQE